MVAPSGPPVTVRDAECLIVMNASSHTSTPPARWIHPISWHQASSSSSELGLTRAYVDLRLTVVLLGSGIGFGRVAQFQKPRLIYDGICNLCVTAVTLLHFLDRSQRIDYVSYQILSSTIRRDYSLTDDQLEGQMHLLMHDGRLLSGSLAIGEVCRLIFPRCFVCNLFGRSQLQRLYVWIAKRRYLLFGCRDSCYAIRQNPS